uniref:NADH-ubiquinone oxidoreductase chain 3 n=2 Tax=Acoptolabrus TaxID=49287 RepID=A0A6C0NA14_9CARA|nr:NADH dehydrogenase subunit 3 [Carabus mirabilissimus mirabilissimus]YP_009737805.1 NADH dehydrogenase subunit 3 [Carabus changeonleei]ACT36237.1 NADH dehydrogenase subunit 3 [Carabus mirabilissimus mirabilissimus]QHW07540.1 NADH dehydrogenase subunit 3 [Carabus changeonleei]
MLIILTMSIIIMILCIIVMLIANILSKKTFMDREKNSPFECGFDPKNSARLPFSLQFFLIAVIFLIFDVEIALLLPMIMIMKISKLLSWMFISFFFLLILLIGLYHEWNQGALNWSN